MCGLVIHDIKEVEGVRQQEEQEENRDEEMGESEVDGEVGERVINVRMKHDDEDGVNKAQTWATVSVHLSRKTVKGQRH